MLLHTAVLAAFSWTFLTSAAVPARAAQWYAAPHGTAKGQGTRQSPWDIATALGGKRPIKPGDKLNLLAGTYRRRPRELFEIRLAGKPNQPIHIRPAPGQHVIIDGGLVVIDPATYVWIWDLEILISEPRPAKPVSAGSFPGDLKRPAGGLQIYAGQGCKYINLVIHDCNQGVSFWAGARDSELYGCLIYDNGWRGVDRGHGHAVYTQNKDGVKAISECIMTGGYGFSMHAYGSKKAFVDNFRIEGNICYKTDMFLIGGGRPSHGIRVLNNYLHSVPMQIGYGAPYNEDCEVRGNIIANAGLNLKRFRKVVNKDNLVLAPKAPRPKGGRVILRPSKYDPRRAHLAVFNWDKKPTVSVDAKAFFKAGDRYRLLDPRSFFGKPLRTGTYDCKAIAVPVASEFAAFVMIKGKK
jgi:hypothetical protein